MSPAVGQRSADQILPAHPDNSSHERPSRTRRSAWRTPLTAPAAASRVLSSPPGAKRSSPRALRTTASPSAESHMIRSTPRSLLARGAPRPSQADASVRRLDRDFDARRSRPERSAELSAQFGSERRASFCGPSSPDHRERPRRGLESDIAPQQAARRSTCHVALRGRRGRRPERPRRAPLRAGRRASGARRRSWSVEGESPR